MYEGAPKRASEQDREYVKRLAEFVKEWENKSDTRKLPEFIEYLDYFEQANAAVCLEDDAPGDAVRLRADSRPPFRLSSSRPNRLGWTTWPGIDRKTTAADATVVFQAGQAAPT